MTTLLPLFDTMENLKSFQNQLNADYYPHAKPNDYRYAFDFLLSYNGSQATFNAYRREVERLLHWSWLMAKKSILELKRKEIEDYLYFCQKPPINWISLKKVPRFIEQEGVRKPNPAWRPFVVTIPKASVKLGKVATIENFSLSDASLREIFAILSSFYNYLINEEATEFNPIALIRQKSKFLRKQQGKVKIRRLSELQWAYLIETAELMAANAPQKHERTLFIITALYAMFLRISELTASARWTPCMNDFHRDQDGNWWFNVIGKGNKQRDIAVSNAMLNALKRWRLFLGLSELPSAADQTPLIPKVRGFGAVSNTSFVRKIVQSCFDFAVERMRQDNFMDDADALLEATVHWLRHTGISEDVKIRPREHVRDDAGHSSGSITDRYIDVELRERHRSAKNKLIKQD